MGRSWTAVGHTERFQVAVTTAARWARRYRQHGEAGMADHSSRPHHSPNRTPTRRERTIIKVRVLRERVEHGELVRVEGAGQAAADSRSPSNPAQPREPGTGLNQAHDALQNAPSLRPLGRMVALCREGGWSELPTRHTATMRCDQC
jgi:hypothetical protein